MCRWVLLPASCARVPGPPPGWAAGTSRRADRTRAWWPRWVLLSTTASQCPSPGGGRSGVRCPATATTCRRLVGPSTSDSSTVLCQPLRMLMCGCAVIGPAVAGDERALGSSSRAAIRLPLCSGVGVACELLPSRPGRSLLVVFLPSRRWLVLLSVSFLAGLSLARTAAHSPISEAQAEQRRRRVRLTRGSSVGVCAGLARPTARCVPAAMKNEITRRMFYLYFKHV